MTGVTFRAGAVWHPGTGLPVNVTGECGHRHRTAEAAQRCIDDMDRRVKRGHGAAAWCDRVVIVEHWDGDGRLIDRHPLEIGDAS